MKKNIHWTTSPVLDYLQNYNRAHGMLLLRTAQAAENSPLPNTLAKNMYSSHLFHFVEIEVQEDKANFLNVCSRSGSLDCKHLLELTCSPAMSLPLLTSPQEPRKYGIICLPYFVPFPSPTSCSDFSASSVFIPDSAE